MYTCNSRHICEHAVAIVYIHMPFPCIMDTWHTRLTSIFPHCNVAFSCLHHNGPHPRGWRGHPRSAVVWKLGITKESDQYGGVFRALEVCISETSCCCCYDKNYYGTERSSEFRIALKFCSYNFIHTLCLWWS